LPNKPSTVHVVHCIDTEGPLHESVPATFERLASIFGIELEPSRALLEQLQAGTVDLGGIEGEVRKVVDPHLLEYNDTWDKVDTMLHRIMAEEFRSRVVDSFGGGWVYSWFCLDHIGYGENPRRRDMGYGNVFSHYRQMLVETDSRQDELHFHFHPHNFRHEAHRCATHWWANSDSLYQILCRRIIDHGWFPVANRPGFHVTRPDSHWFLEQFIPFDFANQALVGGEEDKQADLRGGRFGDWRRAPADWQPYHPSADDYQVPGDCRRWVARCLNVGTRFGLITQDDVDQAFKEALEGKPVVLAVTNHDFRDMAPDVEMVMGLLDDARRRYPEVPFQYSSAVEAMRGALDLPYQKPCELDIAMEASGRNGEMIVRSHTATFGPQPWLSIKTHSGQYLHDNFDIDTPFHEWRYFFDDTTVPLDSVETIGVASNNAYGSTTIIRLDVRTGEIARSELGDRRTGE